MHFYSTLLFVEKSFMREIFNIKNCSTYFIYSIQNIFIKCVDNDKLICEKLDDHIKGLMVNKIENTWDVFGWTYPSKRRGKRIQLKLKLKYFRS